MRQIQLAQLVSNSI